VTLRTRLVATTVLVSVLALAGAGIATYSVFTQFQLKQVDARLSATADQIDGLLARGGHDLPAAIARMMPNTFVQLYEGDGTTAFETLGPSSGGDEASSPDAAAARDAARAAGRSAAPVLRRVPAAGSGGSDLRVRAARVDGGVLIVGESLHEQDEAARRLVSIGSIVAALATVVAGLIGAVLVGIELRPLRRVERTALAIATTGDIRLEAEGASTASEAGRLALAMNTMLERIRGAFAERDATEHALREAEERTRRFVADVSHELRTPLAAVSAYTELIERGARSKPEDLDRALAGMASETHRMASLVEELLLLAHLDQQQPPVRTAIDLSEIVAAAVTTARAVDPTYPIEVRLGGVVTTIGDPDQLRRVVDNLLANIRTHTPSGTPALVELGMDAGFAVLFVRDVLRVVYV
jgi:two-component system OmpR family sensor kinase